MLCVQGNVQERYFELAEAIRQGKHSGNMYDHEDTLKEIRRLHAVEAALDGPGLRDNGGEGQ